ncbi:MAG: O-antigen ligase family protein [Thermodesulfovibrionales bacterium]
MIGVLKVTITNFLSYKIQLLIFVFLLFLSTYLVFDIKIGLIILLGAVLFSTALIQPKWLYMFLIALFPVEGFAALKGASYPKIVAVFLIGGLILRLALTREALPKDNAYKYYYLFFIGSLISFAVAKNLSVSLNMYIVYISLFFLYLLTRHFLRSEKDVSVALNVLFFSTIFLSLIVEMMGIRIRSHYSGARLSGGYADPNEYASYILVLLPLSFYMAMRHTGIKKIVYWGCGLFFFITVVFAGSRGGALGFIGLSTILVYYYSVGRLRQIIVSILFVMTISYFYVPDDYWVRLSTLTHPVSEGDSSMGTRLINYKAAVKMFFDYPVTGVGIYNFQFRGLEYGTEKVIVVHNTYLEVLTGGGLLSFIPFLLILINSWLKLKVKRKYDPTMRDLLICLKASFVSLLITSFFISADHKKILFFLLALISSVHYLLMERRDVVRKI